MSFQGLRDGLQTLVVQSTARTEQLYQQVDIALSDMSTNNMNTRRTVQPSLEVHDQIMCTLDGMLHHGRRSQEELEELRQGLATLTQATGELDEYSAKMKNLTDSIANMLAQ